MDVDNTRADRRMVKGVLIGLVGLALLVGGGTFALWYDSAEVASGEITSGRLALEVGDEASWADQTGPITDIADHRIVPGDVLTLSQPVTVLAEGDTLQAVLSVDVSDIAGNGDDLADALEVAVGLDGAPPAGVVDIGDGTFTITAAELVADSVLLDVDVTITFPSTADGEEPAGDRSNWWHQDAQAETVDLTTIRFDLQQVID